MPRLFVALDPPEEVKDALDRLCEGLPGIRWSDADQFHLTLRFIGEVDSHVADDIAAALGSVVFPRFEIALRGAGRFGEGSRKGSLCVGVTPHDRLATLHKKVDQACIRAGLPSEGRAYLPHITVARLGRAAGPADPLGPAPPRRGPRGRHHPDQQPVTAQGP